MRTAFKTIAICSFALILSACGSAKDANKSNFSNAIQAYLDTQKGLCADIPGDGFPLTLKNPSGTYSNWRYDQAEALAEAGLLKRTNTEATVSDGFSVKPATEYQLTEMGKKFYVPGNPKRETGENWFCTGKYTVVEIDNFTEPFEMMGKGIKESKVKYRYKVVDAADWAKSERILAVYEHFADMAKGEQKDKANLVLTNDGWMHWALFRQK